MESRCEEKSLKTVGEIPSSPGVHEIRKLRVFVSQSIGHEKETGNDPLYPYLELVQVLKLKSE